MKRFRRGISLFIIAALSLFSFAGCALKESPVVMTVGGDKIKAGEYAYFLRLNSSNIDPAQGDEALKAAKELAANQVILMHTIFQKAVAYHISLTEDEREQLKSYKKDNIKATGGTAAYEKELKKLGLTDVLFDKISESSYLYQKLANTLYAEGGPEEPSMEETVDFFRDNYITITYILKKNTDENGELFGGEVVARKREETEALLEKIRDGADFMTFVKTENEDGSLNESNGYQCTFTHAALSPQNAMAAEIEETSFALDVGGISGIVETEKGLHIIKRLPLDEAVLEKGRGDLIQAMSDELFNEQIQEWMETAQVTYTGEYENMTFANLDLYLNK